MSAIAFEGVTKRFGDVTAVDGLDLRVEEGEIYGFLGPNGAGKTTTIDMILDLVRPTAGHVDVLGFDAHEETVPIKRRTGVLPEGFEVYERLTGRQHVQFAIDSKRSNAADDAGALLERVDIADAADRPAGGYSKGMKQRLALAMALAGDPDLLILDEPTTGLDPSGAREVRQIVRDENERGATVFFSSHILSQVEAVCDRVGIIRAGQIVAEDSIEGLREAVGAGARLRVTVDRIDDGLIEAVESVSGVDGVDRDGDTLVVEADDAAKSRVIAAVEDTGVAITNFETDAASLEDLFIAYTEGAA